jgi:hypothetical protein
MSVEKKLLDQMLDETEWREKLSDAQLEAFEQIRARASKASVFVLTEKQSKWVLGVSARIGLIGAEPSENLFSRLTPERQAEQRARAAKVKLPWEKP